MRNLNEIIIHCSATRPNWMEGKPSVQKLSEIRRWHLDKKWADIGYHYVIDRDGTVMQGRSLEHAGAHTVGKNASSIGICLIGGFGSAENDDPSEHFTQDQLDALRTLVEQLRFEHGIRKVSGHNQYAAKACPGFNVPRWYAGKSPERPIVASKTVVGGTTAGVATAAPEVVKLVTDLASASTDAQQALEPLADALPMIRIVCTLLALAGVGLVLYARISDWKKGRK